MLNFGFFESRSIPAYFWILVLTLHITFHEYLKRNSVVHRSLSETRYLSLRLKLRKKIVNTNDLIPLNCTGGWGKHFKASSEAYDIYSKRYLIEN